MSDIRLSVGTKVYVHKGVPENYTIAGFEALSFTEVGEVGSIGEFGGSAQITPFIPLATGVVKKRKGSIDYGTMAMNIGRLAGDDGQALLKAGFDGNAAYDVHSFKVQSVAGDVMFFTGLVGSFTSVINDANSVTAVNCNIELDNRVLADVFGNIVQFIAGTNGRIIGNAYQAVPEGGNTSPVYASANEGYEFEKWSDDDTDNPRILTNVTEDTTLTASFVAEEG